MTRSYVITRVEGLWGLGFSTEQVEMSARERGMNEGVVVSKKP